jgi:hypothetical protein
VSRFPDDTPADLEIGGSWQAGRARWSNNAEVRTRLVGEPSTEELGEGRGLPDRPLRQRSYRGVGRVWRLKAWLEPDDEPRPSGHRPLGQTAEVPRPDTVKRADVGEFLCPKRGKRNSITTRRL